MNTYDSDKKTIQLAMLLIFLSLLVIYVLLFAIKWDNMTMQDTSPTDTTKIIYQENTEPTISSIINDTNTEATATNTDTNQKNTEEPKIWFNTNQIDQTNQMEVLSADFENQNNQTFITTNTKENKNTLDKKDDIYILSGTRKYFGPIKAIEKLGIDYTYALKDEKDIYYIFLWENNYDFDQIARQLGWNTYKINTEQEIMKNKLFGESITYINIPEFKDDTVIILVTISDITRLLQIDYEIYHSSKWHIKNVFGY